MRMEAAREEARQKALEGIKTAGDKDWRALAEWLKLTFPEHRSSHSNQRQRDGKRATGYCRQ
jgi:hypothetical protein